MEVEEAEEEEAMVLGKEARVEDSLRELASCALDKGMEL